MANQFVAFNVPASGAGTALDTSGYGPFKTIQMAGGDSTEVCVIQGSNDAAVTWTNVVTIHGGDAPVSIQAVLQRMRVNRTTAGATTPTINLGAPTI